MNKSLLAALSGLLLVATSACGDVTSADTRESSATSTAEKAETIFAEIVGTPRQQVAAEVVAAYRVNGEFSKCLQSLGYAQPWQNYIQVPAPWDPLAASIWGPAEDRGVGYFSREVQGSAAAARAGIAAEAETPAGQGRAQAKCREAHESVSDDALDAIRAPHAAVRLSAAWERMLATVGESVAPASEYVDCLQASLPKALGVGSMKEAGKILDPELAPDQVPLNADEGGGAGWSRLVEAEQIYARADWACRAAHFDEVMTALAPELVTFEAENADELSSLSGHWADLEAEARTYGWDGTAKTDWHLPRG